MRRTKCRCCYELYFPNPRTYDQQKTCSKKCCRAWRIRQKWKNWIQKNPLYGQGPQIKQKSWRKQHPDYWQKWRSSHPGYVERNRKAQKMRDAKKRGFLAKPTEWKAVCIEELARIRSLRLLAKPTECEQILFYGIDGVCNYLQRQVLLAKPTDIDKRE